MTADDPWKKLIGEFELNADLEYDRFMRRLREFFKESGVETTSRLEPGMVLVVTRADEFKPEDDLWKDPANRSRVRPDVACAGCGRTVAVSNWAYDQYREMAEKPKVVCDQCFLKSPTAQETPP